MVTELHVSVAVATPVLLVEVSAGHSSTTLVGQVSFGAVVSRRVMVCTALILLLQASMAVQVRKMVCVPPQELLVTSLKVMVKELQASEAVATPVRLVLVSAGHSRRMLVGISRAGAAVSCTTMVCSALALLPQASVAVQVRRMVLVLPQALLVTSL